VIRYKGKVFCIDSTCYHAGGPLGLGDIEDLDGDPCIVCPWHHYKITLAEGAKLYQPLEMTANKRLVPSKKWKKKEKAQRTHQVEVRNDGIYVLLSSEQNQDKYDSDEYGENVLCGQQCMSGKESKTNAIAGGDGRITGGFRGSKFVRSGQVFNQFRNVNNNKSTFSRNKYNRGNNRLQSDPISGIHTDTQSGDCRNIKDESKTRTAEDKSHSQWEKSAATCVYENNGYHILLPLSENEQLKADIGEILIQPAKALPVDAFRAYHLHFGVTNSKSEQVTRPYTFINKTLVDEGNISKATHLEFYLRRYDEGEFTGDLKDNLSSLRVKGGLDVSTPEGFLAGCSWDQLDAVCLLAGGSGITPLLQIVGNILACPNSKTKIMLLYFNKNHNSTLALKSVLELARNNASRFAVTLFFSEVCDRGVGEKDIDSKYCSIKIGSKVSAELVKENVTNFIGECEFDKAVMLWCGPPGFNEAAERASLELSLNPDHVYGFEG